MPIALLIIGILVVIAGVKNNASLLEQTIVSDFSGAGSFWYWIAAVLAVGSLGYYQPAKQVSHLFLALIVLVFLLSNGGVFEQLQKAVQSPSPAPANTDAQKTASGASNIGNDIASGNPMQLGTDIGTELKKQYIDPVLKTIGGLL